MILLISLYINFGKKSNLFLVQKDCCALFTRLPSLGGCTAEDFPNLKCTQLFSDSSDTDTPGSEHIHKPGEEGIKE